MHGVTNIMHGEADIMHDGANICLSMSYFCLYWGYSKENTLFSICAEIGRVAEELMIIFGFGSFCTYKSNHVQFFNFFLTLPLIFFYLHLC